jgi:hypothetical protein
LHLTALYLCLEVEKLVYDHQQMTIHHDQPRQATNARMHTRMHPLIVLSQHLTWCSGFEALTCYIGKYHLAPQHSFVLDQVLSLKSSSFRLRQLIDYIWNQWFQRSHNCGRIASLSLHSTCLDNHEMHNWRMFIDHLQYGVLLLAHLFNQLYSKMQYTW